MIHKYIYDHEFQRVFEDNIYPYKTAKHAFPDSGDLKCEIPLSQLKKEITSV